MVLVTPLTVWQRKGAGVEAGGLLMALAVQLQPGAAVASAVVEVKGSKQAGGALRLPDSLALTVAGTIACK